MNVIRFEKVVEAIDAGELVKIQYVSLDIMRKTGGKLRTITGKVTKQKTERSSTEKVQDLKVKKRNLKPPKSHPSAGENQTNGASTSITESKKNNTWWLQSFRWQST
jgi:hypothetical protein